MLQRIVRQIQHRQVARGWGKWAKIVHDAQEAEHAADVAGMQQESSVAKLAQDLYKAREPRLMARPRRRLPRAGWLGPRRRLPLRVHRSLEPRRRRPRAVVSSALLPRPLTACTWAPRPAATEPSATEVVE